MIDQPLSSTNRRQALPPRVQVGILVAGGIVAAFLLLGLPAIAHMFQPKPVVAPTPPPGTFVATDQQWATFRFATVSLTGFRPQTETEGKIATDDDRTTQVFSPFSGRVTRVMATAGERVRAGQPLFAIQATELAQAESDLATAAAQARLAGAEEARLSELIKSSGAALKDLQQSQSDLATAEANVQNDRARLRILGQSEGQIAAVERGGAPGAASADTVVRSPISGVVTQRNIGVGQNLASVSNGGTSAAFVVSDLSKVWLVGDLRDSDVAQARVGQAVQVRTPALPGQVFDAKVDFVSPIVDPTTHRVPVRATIANPDGLLRPDMFASFTLFTDGTSQMVAVPEDAVIFEGDTARVWVARGGHALELRQIKAGVTADGMVQVISGLSPGERVVTSGSLFIDRAAQGD